MRCVEKGNGYWTLVQVVRAQIQLPQPLTPTAMSAAIGGLYGGCGDAGLASGHALPRMIGRDQVFSSPWISGSAGSITTRTFVGYPPSLMIGRDWLPYTSPRQSFVSTLGCFPSTSTCV
jgi:hypothetical protein